MLLLAGIAGGFLSVRDAQICQDGGPGADCGHVFAVIPGEFQRIQGSLAGPETGNAPQTAGDDEHFRIRQIHLANFDIRFHHNLVAAGHFLAVDSNR